MNQRSLAGQSLLPGILLATLLFMAASAMGAVVKSVTLEERGGATQLNVEADGPVTFQDFMLSNPDRLVIDCMGASSLLPPVMDPKVMKGRVRSITTSQWNGKNGESVARIVCELSTKSSYSIASRPTGLVAVIEGGAAANGLGYDEDRLASESASDSGSEAPPEVPAPAPQERSSVGYGAEDQAQAASQEEAVEESVASEDTAVEESGEDAAIEESGEDAAIEEGEAPADEAAAEDAVGGERPVFVIQAPHKAPRYSSRAFGEPNVGERIEARPKYLNSKGAKRVSLDVQRAAVQTVLRTLAAISGRSIVSNQEVSGNVTVRLNEIPWPQALDIVLLTQGLGFTDEEGVLRIASIEKLRQEQTDRNTAARKQEELKPLETRVIPVNFAKAEELKPAVDKLFTPRGHAEVDRRTNSLIVTDIHERVANAQSLVGQLDTRTPQVEIESKLVDLDVSDSRDLGIDWSLTLTEDGGADGLNREQTFISRNPIANPAGELLVGTIQDNFIIDARLQALAESRKANIISNPRISTVNNREASILVGQEIPLIVQDEAFNTVVQLKKIGIKLTVRPHINSDRQIELDVHPEVSDLAAQSTVQGGIIINTSEADTRILVNNGETAVIGGLIRENEALRIRGIPILKDIPLLGWLFRSESKVKQKRELLIFITPRIVGA
jgi:type IV pilus secretin PilQ/predicted competence protein